MRNLTATSSKIAPATKSVLAFETLLVFYATIRCTLIASYSFWLYCLFFDSASLLLFFDSSFLFLY